MLIIPPAFLPDAAGPGLIIGLGILGGVLFGLAVLLEALLIWWLRWGSFGRALIAALATNFASGILGFGMIALLFQQPVLFFVIAFILSVLVEGGVLMLLKRSATRENWRVALIVNGASYALLVIGALWIGLSQG